MKTYQIITTMKPTPSYLKAGCPLFKGQMHFLLPNQQCQSTEGKISTPFYAPIFCFV